MMASCGLSCCACKSSFLACSEFIHVFIVLLGSDLVFINILLVTTMNKLNSGDQQIHSE